MLVVRFSLSLTRNQEKSNPSRCLGIQKIQKKKTDFDESRLSELILKIGEYHSDIIHIESCGAFRPIAPIGPIDGLYNSFI